MSQTTLEQVFLSFVKEQKTEEQRGINEAIEDSKKKKAQNNGFNKKQSIVSKTASQQQIENSTVIDLEHQSTKF
jgi:hypothetical protein